MAGRKVSVVDGSHVLAELQRGLPGYVSPHVGFRWSDASSYGPVETAEIERLIRPYEYDLFSSPAYGDKSELLRSIPERRLTLPYERVEES